MTTIDDSYLEFSYENGSMVISPKTEVDLITWGEENRSKLTEVIKEYGAVVFSGFNLTQETFPRAFEAVTGIAPESYKGNTPRDVVMGQVYKSTAVADAHFIPLHQEVSGGNRADMPKYISFFCVTPPEKGTGQTLVGSAKEATLKIQQLMPDFWHSMQTKSLTYTARYLPKDNWSTYWIRWLNPSFATIEKRFGTEDKQQVEAICQREGLLCEWDNGWAVITRKGVPGTIDIEGESLFCNAIHLDKPSPQLYGGYLYYLFAHILLHPTPSFQQFDVNFDDGTPITPEQAGSLLDIMKSCQKGRDWKEGDLLLLDNRTTFHGKTPHEGPRNILVAMGGSI